MVCDIGGSSLYLLDESGVRREMETSGGLRYYSARLNSSGWLSVTEEKNGYKASVSVYNSSGELVFSFDSYDSYISDALVTEDCRSVVAVGLNAQDGAFGSTLMIYDLSEAVLTASCPIRDGLPMDIACTGDELLALCDTRLAMADLEGNLFLDYPYGSLYLHDYAFWRQEFLCSAAGKYQAGNICDLTTFDLKGEEIASLEITEEILNMSAAGEYLAVLYSGQFGDLHPGPPGACPPGWDGLRRACDYEQRRHRNGDRWYRRVAVPAVTGGEYPLSQRKEMAFFVCSCYNNRRCCGGCYGVVCVWGAKRGLFKSLMGLIVLVLALVVAARAANLITDTLIEKRIRPATKAAIEERVDEIVAESSDAISPLEEMEQVVEAIPAVLSGRKPWSCWILWACPKRRRPWRHLPGRR